MLIYVCYLSVVLCHRRWLVAIFLIGQDWPIHYVFIAETMHVGYAVADKVVCCGIIELAQCLFVRKSRLLSKEFHNASILHL